MGGKYVMTYYKLVNGVAVWAIAKALVTIRGIEREIYLYNNYDLLEYPNHELVDQPIEEIRGRAEQIAGATFSKSEFEKLLYNKTKEEVMQETIDMLILDALERGASDV